jgi:hypothetical protein
MVDFVLQFVLLIDSYVFEYRNWLNTGITDGLTKNHEILNFNGKFFIEIPEHSLI